MSRSTQFVIALLATIISALYASQTQNVWLSLVLASLLLLLIICLRVLPARQPGQDGGGNGEGDIYSLSHARLNLELPPRTMWMNMGYWKHTTDFGDACDALLKLVLQTAGLHAGLLANNEAANEDVRILDLGFGCGDQCLSLFGLRATVHGVGLPGIPRAHPDLTNAPHGVVDGVPVAYRRLRYVGLTLNPQQYQLACSRVMGTLRRAQLLSAAEGRGGGETLEAIGTARSPNNKTARLFQEDAALPETWSQVTTQAIRELFGLDDDHDDENHTLGGYDGSGRKPLAGAVEEGEVGADRTANHDTANQQHRKNWILALDTLYHFHPSRLPIFRHARQDLHASIMAFDLMETSYSSCSSSSPTLSNSVSTATPVKSTSENGIESGTAEVSWLDRTLLRLVCLILGVSIVTQDDYVTMLVDAGYAEDRIEVLDVTEDVFPGLVAFMRRRRKELRVCGGGMGMGVGLRVMEMLFGLWARRGGAVRAVVVVARV